MSHICSHSNKHEKKLMKLKKKKSEKIGWKFLLRWDTKDQRKMSSDAVHLLCKGNAFLHSNTNIIPTVRTSPISRVWYYGFSCAHTTSHVLTHGVLDLVSPLRLHISLCLLRQKILFFNKYFIR